MNSKYPLLYFIIFFLGINSTYAFLNRIRFENGKELNYDVNDSTWYFTDYAASKKIKKSSSHFIMQETNIRWFESGFWYRFNQNGELTKNKIGNDVLAYDSLDNRSVRILESSDTSITLILSNKKIDTLDYILNPFYDIHFVGISDNTDYIFFISNAYLYYFDFFEKKIFKSDAGFIIDIVFCDNILFWRKDLFSLRNRSIISILSKPQTVYEHAKIKDQYFIDFQNKKLHIQHLDGTVDSIDVKCNE